MKTEAPKAIREWYSKIGKRGVAGRLSTLNPVQRKAISAAGVAARAAKRKQAGE
jgi:hypothetical protein